MGEKNRPLKSCANRPIHSTIVTTHELDVPHSLSKYIPLCSKVSVIANNSHDDGEKKRRECKVVIIFSDPSLPERLPLCFGYESETSRLPQTASSRS